MEVEISSDKSWKERILILKANDYYDQQILEEIIKTEIYISVKRDPYTQIILELGIPLISRKIAYSKSNIQKQRRVGW